MPLALKLILVAAINFNLANSAPRTRLLVDLSDQPASQGLSAFDLCVLKVDAQADLEAAHALGNLCLARVPLFDVPVNSPAAKLADELQVPLIEGSEKGVVHLDATHPRWPHVVVHELVETAAERGFDGVVLCQTEDISQDAVRAAVLRVLELIKAAYPDKRLMIEGGFGLVAEARRQLDGIFFIGEKAGEEALTARRIRESARLGVQPYVVGFATPEDIQEIPQRAAAIRELGGVPFFTTRELTGINLGPLDEVSRRVLVLHSGSAEESYTARVLHGSLEWMGYQVVYQNAGEDSAENWMSAHEQVQALILDQSLGIDRERQHRLALMVAGLEKQKVPLLLTGIPWESEEDWNLVSSALKLQGSGRPVVRPGRAVHHRVDSSLLAAAAGTAARTTGLRDVRAAGAETRVLLSVRSEEPKQTTYDQAWLASWGGALLDPLALEIGPQIEPLPFLERWLGGRAVAPVMDTTSLDGHRLLVTQVLSEGFASVSDQPGLPIAAEVMQEKVLARYGLPVTVAVNEGDVRGWTPGLNPRTASRLQHAAREIFNLGNVEPASAGLSRPVSWTGAQPEGGVLNAGAEVQSPGMEREIAGSLAYLHRNLLPKGRAMGAVSWPLGTVPSAEASAFVQRMKVESLVTRRVPSLLAVDSPLQPRSWKIGRQGAVMLQDAGLRQADEAIAAIHRGGLGRWTEPAQVSLRFQDVVRSQDLKQVERLLDWCSSEPFHAISASQYARLVRDAAETRIFQTGPGRWILVNQGSARTVRLPASAGVPDLALCRGVAGFIRHGGQIYIHTLGLRRTELVMRAEPQRDYLRLASATADVRYLEAAGSRASFQVLHTRPVELCFDGMMPGTICQMLTNGMPDYLMADTQGRIEFSVPSQATIQLRILPSNTAAMR
jgi:hypothetical protein